ncbi:PIN domain-containing protein [bacterium]|nr:PIN domain-containing protein [bacterium]RQV95889.1 MAG: type II toxin-antitoxin system VapC family toxin [bacterium]
MDQKILLDAYGLLLYLQKDGPYRVIKTLFWDAQQEKNPILVNEMSIGEVFHIISSVHSIEKAETFMPLLEILPFEIISNCLDDIMQAARIKARYAIGTVSSLVVATAIVQKATLVTGDPEFKKVNGLIPIRWLD